ncbi:NYN domain-containing protein [Sphingosinicella microcystinivorans]|uniref:NYN domain-containing protein n=1 Tax=Sphingosinicella microcystinivorans TaxID=335406 RepID=UPI0022F3ED17|nr:NYN domain-containing protein [Sphingosinicella microcystinivorans]WBX84681.1 NYN domain-containing protein [Sphingosinicella microcystinivorans]
MATNGNERSPNIALLIDADQGGQKYLDAVLTVLAELGTVNIRRAYGNWSKPELGTWEPVFHAYAIMPMQQFDIAKRKNATDMAMAIDAMDLLYSGRVDGFGLMSSDSDFMPLAMRIRQNGLPVYGFGRASTPESFRQACTRFIDVDALMPVPDKAPKGEIDDQLVALLIDAYDAVKRDEQGYARLAEVGKIAGNRSSFDVRNYGFKRLSELVEAVPNFVTERRDGGNVYIRRVR